MTNEQDLNELKAIVLANTAGSVTAADIDRVFDALPKALAEWLLAGEFGGDGYRAEAHNLLIFRAKKHDPDEVINQEHYKLYVKAHQGLEDVLTDKKGILFVNG